MRLIEMFEDVDVLVGVVVEGGVPTAPPVIVLTAALTQRPFTSE
jgi:hypothetical protein